MAAPGSSYTQSGQYSPYPPHGPELSQGGYTAQNPGWRPEWTPGAYHQGIPAYNNPHASPGANISNQSSPASASRNSMDKSRKKRLSHDPPHSLAHQQQQVYSFVPIPGAQQHKRPRRRYEEIERMYKCGWNGCEKAYGTLNHLNAHVTMQSHGQKRTPEEFKEIRKEWKARKKEEEAAARKAEEEQQRHARQMEGASLGEPAQPQSGHYGPISPRQLPPLGYPQQSVPHGVSHYPPTQSGIDSLQPQYSPSNAMYPGYSHAPQYSHSQSQAMYQPRQNQVHQGHEENDADAEPDPDVPAAPYAH